MLTDRLLTNDFKIYEVPSETEHGDEPINSQPSDYFEFTLTRQQDIPLVMNNVQGVGHIVPATQNDSFHLVEITLTGSHINPNTHVANHDSEVLEEEGEPSFEDEELI